jgi:hypothetical protein
MLNFEEQDILLQAEFKSSYDSFAGYPFWAYLFIKHERSAKFSHDLVKTKQNHKSHTQYPSKSSKRFIQ